MVVGGWVGRGQGGDTSRAGSEEFCTPSRSSAHQPAAARMHMDAQQLIGGDPECA